MLDVDDCLEQNCSDHGDCTDRGANAFECVCSTGYTGSECESMKAWVDGTLILTGVSVVTWDDYKDVLAKGISVVTGTSLEQVCL